MEDEMDEAAVDSTKVKAEPTWTPERIALLTELAEEKKLSGEFMHTYGEIAELMTEEFSAVIRKVFTKNMVLGKARRIGLPERGEAGARAAPRRNICDLAGPVCMWPIGDPTDKDFHFCGERPTPGKPYCSEHAAVAYIKPKPFNVARG